jgi:hypothetical protein
MAGYSKVDRKVWSDEKFCGLSRPKPNAQTLWLFLITCPLHSALPGLFSAGEATLAEFLGWPLASFRRHWTEIERAGMVLADWKARLVWLRKGIHYDQVTSLNMAKAWGRAMRQLPECPLKTKAEAYVYAYIEANAYVFLNAYREGLTFGKGYSDTVSAPVTDTAPAPGTQPNPMPRPMPRPQTAPGTAGAPGERGGFSGSPDTRVGKGPPTVCRVSVEEKRAKWQELRSEHPETPEREIESLFVHWLDALEHERSTLGQATG